MYYVVYNYRPHHRKNLWHKPRSPVSADALLRPLRSMPGIQLWPDGRIQWTALRADLPGTKASNMGNNLWKTWENMAKNRGKNQVILGTNT